MKWYYLIPIALAGCATPSGVPEPEQLPTLSNPPQLSTPYNHEERTAVVRYYNLLEDYYVYLGKYMEFMAQQYDLDAADRRISCIVAIRQVPIEIEPIPDIRGYSDEGAVNRILDHVADLRKRVYAYNEKVAAHNAKIDELCL